MSLRPKERCPIHRRLDCCGRQAFPERHRTAIKHSDEVRIGPGVFRLPDGRERRTKSALERLKKQKLAAGELCMACDEGFDDYRNVELGHRESCGMNGHKRNDSPANLGLIHLDENREQGSRSLIEYLKDQTRIALKKEQK